VHDMDNFFDSKSIIGKNHFPNIEVDSWKH
jgi:hypothetical protein